MSQIMQMADEISNRASVFSLKNLHEARNYEAVVEPKVESVLLSKTNSAY